MFIKICGITTEEDALLSVALGADAVGFVFAPSTRQVAADRVRDIVRRLPPEVLTVGVFRDELPNRVIELVQKAGLKAAQLHGHESAEDTVMVRQGVGTVIKAFPAGHPGLHRLHDYGADAVLIDGATPGSGEVFDWSLAEDAPVAGHNLILAGGLSPDNVEAAIERVKPWGVDVASGVEKSPGKKDPTRLRSFIERARRAGEGLDVGGSVGDNRPFDWQLDAE